jgi:hypothetical protein
VNAYYATLSNTSASNQSSLNIVDYSSSRAETPIADRPALAHARTRSEIIQSFQDAIDLARLARQPNEGEKIEPTTLSLNVDMGHRNIEEIPDEVIDILKRNAEQYVYYCLVFL